VEQIKPEQMINTIEEIENVRKNVLENKQDY
jgi:hypothetical protein